MKTRPAHPHWMLALTPLAMISGVYAHSEDFLLLAYSEWAVLCTSIIYWTKPACEVRRKIDMIIVQLALYIHIFFAFSLCYTSLFLYKVAICFYVFGIIFDSNFFHAFMWICGSFANFFLISNMKNNIKA